ncbi:MAG: iron ABC transporter permease [Phycisphaerales bacterium]|nr:iron ABC transporter permease [Phycisphaerales bacterium]MCB9840446.1 iron ABC transporter permease [Phycisphaeraceae bacterium]
MARRSLVIAALLVGLVVSAFERLMVGGSGFGWADDAGIVGLRAIALASGVVVGGCLGLAGAQLQALLRNPLASPDLLGMSAGAGLAVAIASLLGGAAALGSPVPAGIGALGALALVYVVAQRGGLIEPVSLILIGVIVAVMLSAMTLVVQTMMPRGQAFDTSRWMLGALSPDATWQQIGLCAAALGGALTLSLVLGPTVDGAAFGDDEARSLGVPLAGLRVTLFIASGVLTAASVVLAGPVGFVGLVCPHAVRLLLGPTHRGLVVGSVLAGAIMVVQADVVGEVVRLRSGRLPMGVMTAMVGGPVLLVLLRAELRGRGRL